MRFLKSLISVQVLFAGLWFFVNAAQAQDVSQDMIDRVKNIQISPEQVVNDMKDKLGINDDQAEKILPIITEQVAAMKEVMNGMSSGATTPQNALMRMQSISNKTKIAFAQILTPEQMEKWQGLMHQGQEKANQMIQDGNLSSMPVAN